MVPVFYRFATIDKIKYYNKIIRNTHFFKIIIGIPSRAVIYGTNSFGFTLVFDFIEDFGFRNTITPQCLRTIFIHARESDGRFTNIILLLFKKNTLKYSAS